ncbi:cellulose biosynthesis cyclic di-GMP-binding regulatory protein BcsB [Trinickia symbiotica]|uniref:cellulose biosynthesis cyclic di-GMP-binding regulatory protein BcsB n=1 Tax=Trinickia symbiotica TaxID=863227 RepID=UPI00215945AB|nr:cellulose biosynthesis cyclic di-GMP-binding regulatory protein BcsB [Trinickia symbiotica]
MNPALASCADRAPGIRRYPVSRRLTVAASWLLGCSLAAVGSGAAAQPATPAAASAVEAPARMGDFAQALANPGNSVTTRTVVLSRLGVRDTVLLDAPQSIREYYLPVPAGVPLDGAELHVDADYLRADGGRTTMLVSLDGTPVLARGFTQPSGDAAAALGVSGDPRASGFVRVAFTWSSVIDNAVCADQTAIGNVLRVAPTTRLTYRYDTNDVKDLRTALTALPQTPSIVIAAQRVGAPSYDAAWRAAALMQRDGREVSIHAWPKVGDTIDLGTLNVPAALRVLPAFAALAAGGNHRLASDAEIGALIALAPERVWSANLIVADDALRAALNASLDALQAQAQSVSREDADALDAWRKRALAPLATPLAAGETRLVHFGGQAAIVVSDSKAIDVLAQAWRPVDVSDQLVVHDIESGANGKADVVALAALGGEPRSVDVRGEASWSAAFDTGAVASAGRLPKDVVLDLAAAPNSSGNRPVASIYFNDVLIGAKLLDANGRTQRVVAAIPPYALAARNVLRVTFKRPPDGGCTTRLGYPVAVLPSSHLTLARGDGDDSFTGMVARFAQSANIMVPASYLADAPATLRRVARLADAVGVAPQRAVLTVTPDGQDATPAGPFFAIDVPLAGAKSHVRVANDGLSILGPDEAPLYDVGGVAKLTGIGVLDVEHAGGTAGVVYRSVGTHAPVLPTSFQLARGDVAVIDSSGVLRQLDTVHAGSLPEGSAATPWTQQWLMWVVPAAIVAAFAVLLLLASFVRRSKERNRAGE